MKHNQAPFYFSSSLIAICACCLLLAAASCNNSGQATSATSTTEMLIINASPDVLPVNVYFGSYPLGGVTILTNTSTTFKYPIPSKYYYVNNGLQDIQVRDHNGNNIALRNDSLKPYTNYSLYIVGLASAADTASALTSIVTNDASAVPSLGYGKIRFVNVSPRTPGLDLYANGTQAFTGVAYKGVSQFKQLPAGTYDFKVYTTGTTTGVLTDLPLVTIQDGRLYTLFTHGLTGRTDTAAIAAAVVTNK